MTQRDLILQYLEDFGSITPFQAFADLGITKLATRISEMRKDGIGIKVDTIKSVNRYGKATTYAKYSLEENDA